MNGETKPENGRTWVTMEILGLGQSEKYVSAKMSSEGGYKTVTQSKALKAELREMGEGTRSWKVTWPADVVNAKTREVTFKTR